MKIPYEVRYDLITFKNYIENVEGLKNVKEILNILIDESSTENNVNKAVSRLVKLADSKSSETVDATALLGFCYEVGLGVTEDKKHAFKLYTPAANQGHVFAQYGLGYCYGRGVGVAKDEKRAFELYTLAANKGLQQAQCNLGVCYDDGHGVAKDETRAFELYTLSASQGFAQAQCNLGACYTHGIGVAKDAKRAAEFFTLAAKQGHDEAQCHLGAHYYQGTGVVQDTKCAFELFTLSANQGCAQAQYNLGIFYEEGIWVSKDAERAVGLYTMAANQGYSAAKEALARIFSGSLKRFKSQDSFDKNERPKNQKEGKSKREGESIKQQLLKQQKLAMQEKRKAERESADYLNKINDLYGKIMCFPNRFNNYIKDEFKLSKKIDEVNKCVKSVQDLLQERNELLTKNRFKVERQEKNRQNDIAHNDEKIKEVNALLETITGIVQTINDLQKTFNLSYFTDSASMKQLLMEGELQKPEKFLQDLEDLLDSCKKAVAKFTENYKELERIKTLIEGKKLEEEKRGKIPFFMRSDLSLDPSEEEKKSQEDIHENREAAFNWMYRLDRTLQVTHKQPETIESDAKYHTQLQEERRNRKALALQERDARLQKKQEEAARARKEKGEKEKELFSKSKEPIKKSGALSAQQLEVLFSTDISFEIEGEIEIESEVKTRKEPESFNSRIFSVSKFPASSRSSSSGFSKSSSFFKQSKPSKPSKKRTLESLTDLSSTLDVYDQLAILEKTLTTIPYEDKALTQTEATITYNALLGVCARAMECLKKLRIHGLVFPEMARQFRNVVFHSGDQSIIPIIDKDPKANQERLNQLRDMAIKLLSYLNSDQFKKMRHDRQDHADHKDHADRQVHHDQKDHKGHEDHHDHTAKKLSSEDPIDPKTQIINSIDSPLFTKIILSNLSQEKDLKTCKSMLTLSDQELDSYKNYRATAPDSQLSLQSLLPLAEGFTKARISTYASYMKWHSGNERYRVIYYQFPKEKRAFYDLQIEAGKRFRHGEKC